MVSLIRGGRRPTIGVQGSRRNVGLGTATGGRMDRLPLAHCGEVIGMWERPRPNTLVDLHAASGQLGLLTDLLLQSKPISIALPSLRKLGSSTSASPRSCRFPPRTELAAACRLAGLRRYSSGRDFCSLVVGGRATGVEHAVPLERAEFTASPRRRVAASPRSRVVPNGESGCRPERVARPAPRPRQRRTPDGLRLRTVPRPAGASVGSALGLRSAAACLIGPP